MAERRLGHSLTFHLGNDTFIWVTFQPLFNESFLTKSSSRVPEEGEMEDNKQAAGSSPRWGGGVEPAKEMLTATGTQILEFECRQQPARLGELLQAYATDSSIESELRKFRGLATRRGPVLFIGM